MDGPGNCISVGEYKDHPDGALLRCLRSVGLIMRLFRDPLDRKLHDGCSSYWKQKESRSFDPKTYEHQF